MKEEYDFTNAEQGRFYQPMEELEIPIYLDRDIREVLLATPLVPSSLRWNL